MMIAPTCPTAHAEKYFAKRRQGTKSPVHVLTSTGWGIVVEFLGSYCSRAVALDGGTPRNSKPSDSPNPFHVGGMPRTSRPNPKAGATLSVYPAVMSNSPLRPIETFM